METTRTVLVTRTLTEEQLGKLHIVAPDWEIVATADPEEMRAVAGRAEVVYYIVNSVVPPRPLLEGTPDLRWVHTSSQGVDYYLFPRIMETDVILSRSAGVQCEAIGEHTMGLVLALAKNFPRYFRDQLARRWQRIPAEMIAGKALVLVGLGGLGSEIALRARALGMRVVAVDIRPPAELRPELADLLLPGEELHRALGMADYLVMAVPLTSRTRGMIGERELRLMKPTARVISVCRGPVVQEAALVAALREGRLAGAGLDVTEVEPLPAESPLWEMENVIITPHCSGQIPGIIDKGTAIFTENLRRYVDGEPLLHVVDKAREF
ncbi:MAG: D-2-hydroxyacid dehydrogenase [Chloroflexi bacterium]|nr:D-2-hydroxyacid dehydrogenase [Chloroflexota bacterium]